MFVEVISFCAIVGLPNTPEMCIWYSDVNTYYENETTCVKNIEMTLSNEEISKLVTHNMYMDYGYFGPIDYIGYCVKDTDLLFFFKENGLDYTNIPETI